jgi:hypothetical protein
MINVLFHERVAALSFCHVSLNTATLSSFRKIGLHRDGESHIVDL